MRPANLTPISPAASADQKLQWAIDALQQIARNSHLADIRNVAGLSVFGRAGNTTGDLAAITGTDGQVLRVNGTTLGFGTIASAGIADASVTYAKIQNVAGLSVVGRSAAAAGVGGAITGAADQILQVNHAASALGFVSLSGDATLSGGALTIANSAITAAKIAADAVTTVKILDANVTYAKIANGTGLSVIGRSANSAGVNADLVGTSNQVLVVNAAGTNLGFGALPNPSATTLGGIESLASSASHWINAISTSGVPSATQPAFSDISGSASVAQLGSTSYCAGRLVFRISGVNFNSGNTDNAIAISLPTGFTRYQVSALIISNASHTLVTATAGLFTATGGGGVAIVTAASAITVSATTDATNNNSQAMTIANTNTETYTSATLQFRVATAEGAAATADVCVIIIPVS